MRALTRHCVKGERVAVHGPFNPPPPGRHFPRPTLCSRSELYLPCNLRTLLLKNEHDISGTGTTTGAFESAFPCPGHIDRHQRPVDPVLLRAAARAHESYRDDRPRSPHSVLPPPGG